MSFLPTTLEMQQLPNQVVEMTLFVARTTVHRYDTRILLQPINHVQHA
jgi:hypothetical protein